MSIRCWHASAPECSPTASDSAPRASERSVGHSRFTERQANKRRRDGEIRARPRVDAARLQFGVPCRDVPRWRAHRVVAVTVAPATTEPALSLTEPTIEPVISCANETAPKHKLIAKATETNSIDFLLIFFLPFADLFTSSRWQSIRIICVNGNLSKFSLSHKNREYLHF